MSSILDGAQLTPLTTYPFPLPRPRYFDEVDTVTGTSEADTFEVKPLKIEKILFTAPPKEESGFETQFAPRIPTSLKESSQSSEVDTLVYQEQERATYLEGFQAPTAHSYTYIEDFEPIEDEIIVGGNAIQLRLTRTIYPC